MRISHFSLLLPLLSFAQAQDLGWRNGLRTAKEAFVRANIPADLSLTFNPRVILEVTFSQPSRSAITLQPGFQVPLSATTRPPTFSVTGAARAGPFVIAAVDPDAPTPDNPTCAQIRHFLGGDFYVPSSEWNGGLERSIKNNTAAVSEWKQPAPPAGSAKHRYIFLIFDQPANFDSQTLVTASTSTMMFNISAFSEATGLGRPIGGTFMLVAPE